MENRSQSHSCFCNVYFRSKLKEYEHLIGSGRVSWTHSFPGNVHYPIWYQFYNLRDCLLSFLARLDCRRWDKELNSTVSQPRISTGLEFGCLCDNRPVITNLHHYYRSCVGFCLFLSAVQFKIQDIFEITYPNWNLTIQVCTERATKIFDVVGVDLCVLCG